MDIKEINNLNALIDEYNNLTSESIVLFDIDEVVIMSDDAVIQTPQRRAWMNKSLYASDYQGVPYYASIIWPHTSLRIVDNQIFNLLLLLQQRNISTMGLTAGWAGALGNIKDYHIIRHQRLSDLGINFNTIFCNKEYIILESLSHYEHHPLFYNNILFCCRIAKHLVFEKFINQCNYTPKQVIFIDDTLEHLINVGNWCQQQGIIFRGFHFTRAQEYIKDLDQKRAELQIEHLKSHNKWLTDQQADFYSKNI